MISAVTGANIVLSKQSSLETKMIFKLQYSVQLCVMPCTVCRSHSYSQSPTAEQPTLIHVHTSLRLRSCNSFLSKWQPLSHPEFLFDQKNIFNSPWPTANTHWWLHIAHDSAQTPVILSACKLAPVLHLPLIFLPFQRKMDWSIQKVPVPLEVHSTVDWPGEWRAIVHVKNNGKFVNFNYSWNFGIVINIWR